MTSTEMTKKTKNEVAAPLNMDEWGGSPITSQDIVLPYIKLMQPMAKEVTAGDASFGDLVESLGNKKLGDFKTPLEVVPFYLQKVYIEYDVRNGTSPKDKKYLGMVQITAANDNLPYEEMSTDAEGKEFPLQRDRCMIYYVLIPSEIDKGTALPHTITFKRTSIKAGKKLATQMYIKNKDAGLPPPAVMCEISVDKVTNDAGTYGVLDVEFTGKAKTEYVEAAKKWMGTILAGQAKVDDNAVVEEPVYTDDNSQANMAEPENF